MKRIIFILFLSFQLVGCAEIECNKSAALTDKIQQYLNYAASDTLPIVRRIAYNYKAEELVQRLYTDSIKTKYLFKVADRYYNIAAFTQYKNTCDDIFADKLLSKDNSTLAKALEYYGDYYLSTTARDSAFYFYTKAEKLYLHLGNTRKLASITLNRASILFNKEDYYGAESAVLKSLNYYKNTQEHRKIFECYILLGLVAQELVDYSASLRYFEVALNTARQHLQGDIEHPDALTYNNIGILHQQSGNTIYAIKFITKALSDPKVKDDNPRLYARLLENLAYSKSQIGEKSEVILELYSRSLDIKNQLIDTSSYLFTKIRLAEYLLESGDSIRAVKLSKEVLEIANTYNDTVDINMALKVLILADHKNSSVYAKSFLNNMRSLQNSETKARNKFARFKFDTDQIINERENAIKQKWIVLSVAILIVFIITLLHVIKVQRAKHLELKLLQAQQTTNEEIYSLILDQQKQVDEGREKEKRRISRDLHDGVMNRLTSTRLNLDILNTRYDLQTVKSCLPYISGIQEIEKEIRSIAHDLTSNIFTKKDGFKSLISTFLQDQISLSKANCHFQIDNDLLWELVESHCKVHIYRILQEIFQNINKHAEAKNIVLSITHYTNTILIEVSDDGKGFSKNYKAGLGISNIKIRVETINGNIEIRSGKNIGTSIKLRIPLKQIN